jgi:hypothetical protein
MSYLASIYACLLALFGALLVWALPMVVYAAMDSFAAWHRERLARRTGRPTATPSRSGGAPAAQPVFRTGLPEAAVR